MVRGNLFIIGHPVKMTASLIVWIETVSLFISALID